MKKVLFLFALIMSMVTTNAQTDTIFTHTGVVVSDQEPVVINLDSTWTPINGCITFEVDGLTDSSTLMLYVGEDIYDYDMILTHNFDTLYTDEIDHIDTNYMHPGIPVFDTVYVIDTIMEYTDTSMVKIFHNGYNVFSVEFFESIDSFAFAVASMNSIDVNITNIICMDEHNEVGIETVEDIKIVVYPNPVRDIIHLEGEFREVSVFDVQGRCLGTTDSHTLDMSRLNQGMYFLRIEGKIIKVQKI